MLARLPPSAWPRIVQPRAATWGRQARDSMMKVLLGDGRRLYRESPVYKADIYFHSGYYPSIFDRPRASEGKPP